MIMSNNDAILNDHAIPLDTLSIISTLEAAPGGRSSNGGGGSAGGSDSSSRSRYSSTLMSPTTTTTTTRSSYISPASSSSTTATTSTSFERCPLQVLSVDKRAGQHDFVASLIPEADPHVQDIISIGTSNTCTNNYNYNCIASSVAPDVVYCHAFMYQDTVFMSLPAMMVQNKDHNEFYACVSELIAITETLDCEYLVIAVEKNSKSSSIVLRALLYTGFQLVDPRLYKQNPVYVFAGYEI
ncbi:hypothetical protein BDB00DRAFT_808372 [Zychaea mexicana]|uniref:uncharacterized protein n=1 Tax=Zychaea mexicana TaxID=64656 RepID=UPI0022FF382B|nr:uncharacterized protein BDB00DRAFT_808372 [Zychaea mexicana]KAI9496692.1 hypothetical protein BDB00DRAFT_808372 [Zychaea mexicana]